jgi:RNA polymerase primary sigma factor
MIEIVNKLVRISRQLVQTLGREPTSAEIAQQRDIPEAKVRKVRKIMRVPISLETPMGEEGDSHLSDLIEDRGQTSPAEVDINANLRDRTAHVLRTLSAREEKIIRMRFGMEDGSERTLVGRFVRRYPRAHSPDRSQGSAQAAPSFAFPRTQGSFA